MPHALMQPIPSEMQASELSADNNLGCPVLFSPNDMASQFSKKNFKFWLVWPQNSFHFATVHFKWALAQTKTPALLDHV